MASTYSPSLKIELMGTGDQTGTWGTTTNNNFLYALEEGLLGYINISFASDANKTLTLSDSNAAQDARNLYLYVTSGVSLTATRDLIVPTTEKPYIVHNATTGAQSIRVKTAAGTGITIPNGSKALLYADGTNVVMQFTYVELVAPALGTPTSGTLTNCTGLPISTGVSGLGTGVATFLATPTSANLAAAVTNETGSGALVFATSPTLTTPVISSIVNTGTLTLPTSTDTLVGRATTDTLTNKTINLTSNTLTATSAQLAAAVSDETGSGALVFATSPTLVTPILGTPQSGTLTSCTGLPIDGGTTGTLPVARGGTGITAFGTGVATALGVNVGSAGAFVVNGGALGTPSSGTLTSCTGLPIDGGTTGTLPVARGGTGITAFGTGVATALGVNVGSAGAFVVNGGALGTPSSGTLTSCTGLPIVAGTTGTLSVARGGTGITAFGTGVATALGVNVGSSGAFVVNGGALGTPSSGTLTSCTGLPVSGVSGLGTGVATALAVNVGSAGAFVVNGGALGTPSSGTLTSCTGLPISTGVSGLGTGVATFLATPNSANLASAVTDETGSGALVFATSPTLVTPVLGTPSSGTLTSCTGLPISTGVSGLGDNVATFLATPSSANLASAVTDGTGSGSLVFASSPTLAAPNVNGSGISYPDAATYMGVGANEIAFGWDAPDVYVSVDNAVFVAFATVSDYRLKKDVQTYVKPALDVVNSIRVVDYEVLNLDGNQKEKNIGEKRVGVIAHEIQELILGAASGEKDAVNADGTPRYQSVNYNAVVPYLIKAIQELANKIKLQEG